VVSVPVVDGDVGDAVGDRVVERTLRLGDRTFTLAVEPAAILGNGSEVVPDATGELVYYTTTEEPTDAATLNALKPGEPAFVPVIRRVDLAGGGDEVFRVGGYAVTVAGDGRVGFVEDVDGVYVWGEQNPDRVVVSSPAGDEVWSTEEVPDYVDYDTVGWAGDVLIVHQILEGTQRRVLAFDGPGEGRVLTEEGGMAAISPDGSEVLIEEGYGSLLVVVDPRDGSRKAVLDPSVVRAAAASEFDGMSGEKFLIGDGDWEGDRMVLSMGTGYVHENGFALLRRTGDGLSVDRIVFLPVKGIISVHGIDLAADGGTVSMQVTTDRLSGRQTIYEAFDVVCDLGDVAAPECRKRPPVANANAGAPVGNPSGWEGGS